MGYLITQIIVCLLISALIGFILGWLLRGLICKDSDQLNDNGSGFNKRSTMNKVSSSGSSASVGSSSLKTNHDDDFYPEPVTIAPAKPRKNESVESMDLSSNKSTINTLSRSSVSKASESEESSNQAADFLSKASEKTKDLKSSFIDDKSNVNTSSSSDSSGLESDSLDTSNQVDEFYPDPVSQALEESRKIVSEVNADLTSDKSASHDLSSSKDSSPKDSSSLGKNSHTNASEKSNKFNQKNINKETKSNISDNKSTVNTLSSSDSSSSFDSNSIKINRDDDVYPEPVTKAPTISHKIEKIEGIGKSLGNKIRKAGVKTTKDLLKTCSTKTGFQQVVEATEVTEDTVTQWLGMADLMRIPNVDGQIAELMLASGIKSPEVLSKANSQALTEEMATVNRREKKIPASIELPSAEKIAEMIKAAKTI